MKYTIYHNPRCSKSREALEMLRNEGIEPVVVEYLKNPPSKEEILGLMAALKEEPAALVRTKEEKYKELGFGLSDKETVAKELARHPELLERPIVVRGKLAMIGRPPEKIKALLK